MPYTCSLVLFHDPRAHAATAANSDLILNTSWSLGRLTPFIGSKAFDALKLWATIKFLGRQGLGRMIDERLALTHTIQAEIEARHDVMLMNVSDINSCMMVFLPEQVQQWCLRNGIQLSDSDLEKVNRLNRQIKEGILQDGTFYVHGFSLKSCPHDSFVALDKPLYVLRTLNGNPASTIANVRALLDKIEQLGRRLFAESEYQLMGSNGAGPNRVKAVQQKLHVGLRSVFGGEQYIAIICGSSALRKNALLSDIDLMVFAPTAHQERHKALKAMFCEIMEQEGILIDAEVPFECKLLVMLLFAHHAAEAGPPLDEGRKVLSIRKTSEYLASDKMIRRLVFNVLTTPNKVFSASEHGTAAFRQLEQVAGRTLVNLIRGVTGQNRERRRLYPTGGLGRCPQRGGVPGLQGTQQRG